ncbi:MAG TPA: hypothetical protein DHW82_12475 [Spirochaetia bacterium]|nr:MAG: hypothetical protein A2Y41_03890 [Spirochaetes bacterium GWB1_36_13]HCL57806.1 hypothetical protein [Spirochaetia bacterium]
MGLKTFTIDFAELITEKGVRNDFKYFDWKKNKKRVFVSKIKLGKSLNSYYKGFAFKGDDFLNEGEIFVLKGVNFNSDYSIDFENIQYLSDDFFDDKRYSNFKVKKDDMILSLVGSIGKIALIEEDYKMLLNQNNISLRLNKDLFHLKYFTYTVDFLLKEIIKKLYSNSGYSFLRIEDLFDIDLPLIPKPIQDQIVSQIEPIEKKIKEVKATIKDPRLIINEVFAREFEFDLEKFEEMKKEKYFEVKFSKINTSLIRSTVIQNKLSSNFLKLFLSKKSVFLKDIILKPIKRGKQPEYTEDGIKVIKTLNIQKGKITFDEVQFVSENFLIDNEEKAGIYQNDLLLTSTGMGRGKFALYEDEETCFADSHVSIIRFNQEKITPNFLNYYCQSFFGVEQLKYIEMHIKGTPEIYEAQLNYFQIPNIPLTYQQKIVDEIKEELDKQEEIKRKIEKERNKIDEIIKHSIKKKE